jgi:hypothetical protein
VFAAAEPDRSPPAPGPYVQTVSGRWVNPFDPDPEQLDAGERFRIKADVPEIKRADRALLATERRAFSAEDWHWPELKGIEPLELELTALAPDAAARAFAERYAELDARRSGV